MKKAILIALILAGCGGGGGGGESADVICTNPGYPLACQDTNWCCPAGHPNNCDGMCHVLPCPSFSVVVDECGTNNRTTLPPNTEPVAAIEGE